jgi:hypothetical protein
MAEPMSGLSRAKSVVVVRRKKPREIIYVRAYPETAINPTPNQIRARVAFGETASKARGVKYKDRGEGLPPAAEYVRKELSGAFFGRSPKTPKWLQRLFLLLQPPVSEEELRRLITSITSTTS